MAKKSWLSVVAAEAITRSLPDSAHMTDLSTSLDLLELHYQGIHDHLPPSELEIVIIIQKLIHFESCKRFVLSQIEKYLDDSESDQAVI
jgi:hypothetical protein